MCPKFILSHKVENSQFFVDSLVIDKSANEWSLQFCEKN